MPELFHTVADFERAMFPRDVEARERAAETPAQAGRRAATEALARAAEPSSTEGEPMPDEMTAADSVSADREDMRAFLTSEEREVMEAGWADGYDPPRGEPDSFVELAKGGELAQEYEAGFMRARAYYARRLRVELERSRARIAELDVECQTEADLRGAVERKLIEVEALKMDDADRDVLLAEHGWERERALVKALNLAAEALESASEAEVAPDREARLAMRGDAVTARRAALAGQTEQAKPCPHGDPTCPCQDGDPCHYEDFEGTGAMRPPEQAAAVKDDL